MLRASYRFFRYATDFLTGSGRDPDSPHLDRLCLRRGSTTEQKNKLAEVFAARWKDEALKARFMADPKAVLAEYDMPVPDGIDVKALVATGYNNAPVVADPEAHGFLGTVSKPTTLEDLETKVVDALSGLR